MLAEDAHTAPSKTSANRQGPVAHTAVMVIHVIASVALLGQV